MNPRNLFFPLFLLAISGGFSSSYAADCEDNPSQLTISVSGAQPTSRPNYYVVAVPEQGTTTVTLTASGKTPCPNKCVCCTPAGFCKSAQDPEKDGDPIYTFIKPIGDQNPPDGPTIKIDITPTTPPNEYKFKVVKIEQKYKACPAGFTGGSRSETNSQASEEVTLLVGAIKRAVAPASNGDETFELITDANRKVLPGQKMILKCEIPAHAVQEYEWILPGEIFKDYTANEKTGERTPLPDGDKKQQIVRFYWADTGDAREVTCRVKIDNQWHDIKNKIDVKKPTVTFTTTLGKAGMNREKTVIGLLNTPNSPRGITFTGKVTVPAGFPEGKWHWLQLVTPQITTEFKTEEGEVLKLKGNQNGMRVLDTYYPYPYSRPFSANQADHDTNTTNTTEDTPFLDLDPMIKVAIKDESFDMYIMFLPPGEQSRYVPTQKVNWRFSVSATKTGDIWALDALLPLSPRESASAAADVSEHPQWNDNVEPSELVPQ